MAAEHVNVTLVEATIAKLDLKPDDVIVLRITDPSYKPTQNEVDYMRQRVREILGDHEILILAYGLELEVVQKEAT